MNAENVTTCPVCGEQAGEISEHQGSSLPFRIRCHACGWTTSATNPRRIALAFPRTEPQEGSDESATKIVLVPEGATALAQSGMAIHHLFAAGFFAEQATAYEQNIIEPTESQRREHRGYVLGTLFTATAFMEASINELYLAALDADARSELGLADSSAEALGQKWRAKGKDRRWSLMNKFQDALKSSQLPPYDEAAVPFIDALTLVALRNATTEYAAKWQGSPVKDAEIEEKLRGRFAESRFAQPGHAFFPHRCLGAGCARWAASAASIFVADFRERMGLKGDLVSDGATSVASGALPRGNDVAFRPNLPPTRR